MTLQLSDVQAAGLMKIIKDALNAVAMIEVPPDLEAPIEVKDDAA